jgi:DNA polymerase III epsilon subunit-like protein
MRWTDHPIVMLDTETTGLLWTHSRVIEVAAVAFRLTSEPLVPEFLTHFETLIHPGPAAMHHPATTEALAVNKISEAELAQAPAFPEAAQCLRRFMGEVASLSPDGEFSVTAFNAEFDHRMLAAEWLRTGLDLPPWLECRENWNASSTWIDPLVWCRDADRYAKGGHSLARQRTRLGITSDGQAHRALTDVQDAAKVLNWLVNGGHPALTKARTSGRSLGSLEDLLAKQDVLAAAQNHDLQAFFYTKRNG